MMRSPSSPCSTPTTRPCWDAIVRQTDKLRPSNPNYSTKQQQQQQQELAVNKPLSLGVGLAEDIVSVGFLPPLERRLPPRPSLGHVHTLGQQESVRHGLKRGATGLTVNAQATNRKVHWHAWGSRGKRTRGRNAVDGQRAPVRGTRRIKRPRWPRGHNHQHQPRAIKGGPTPTIDTLLCRSGVLCMPFDIHRYPINLRSDLYLGGG